MLTALRRTDVHSAVPAVITFGQSATTSLRGTITDAKGAVVTGATVTLNNRATGFSRTTKTDDQGVYQFLELPPATYVMTVTARRLRHHQTRERRVAGEQPGHGEHALQVQGGSVIVDVSGEAPRSTPRTRRWATTSMPAS